MIILCVGVSGGCIATGETNIVVIAVIASIAGITNGLRITVLYNTRQYWWEMVIDGNGLGN